MPRNRGQSAIELLSRRQALLQERATLKRQTAEKDAELARIDALLAGATTMDETELDRQVEDHFNPRPRGPEPWESGGGQGPPETPPGQR